MATTENRQHYLEAAMQMLTDWGLDPYEMAVDGIGETGYLTRDRDAFGKTVMTSDGEGIKLIAHDWPTGFPVQEFMERFHRLFE